MMSGPCLTSHARASQTSSKAYTPGAFLPLLLVHIVADRTCWPTSMMATSTWRHRQACQVLCCIACLCKNPVAVQDTGVDQGQCAMPELLRAELCFMQTSIVRDCSPICPGTSGGLHWQRSKLADHRSKIMILNWTSSYSQSSTVLLSIFLCIDNPRYHCGSLQNSYIYALYENVICYRSRTV
jgi:hypothetical protein